MAPKSSPCALILIADGTEEMEFTITYDTLVRAGISCTSAYVPSDFTAQTPSSITSSPTNQVSSTPIIPVKGSRGIRILADVYFSEAEFCSGEKYSALIIPGGAQGASTLSKSPAVQSLVRGYIQDNKFVGMICAGSLAALTANLPHQPLTSHPSVKSELENHFAYSEDAVIVSGHLVTSRGPGTAFPFALTLVSLLVGPDKREEVRGPMCFPAGTPW
jgi:protein DJ-1